MRCDEGLAAVDNLFAISFERICRVVQADAKQNFDEVISQPIEKQLHLRIINRTATAHEAAAKNAIVPFIEFLPIPHNVAAIVRSISHHNDGSIARHMSESVTDRAPESMRRRIFHGPQGGNAALG